MATFGPAFDKMIHNEGGPLESTVMKREDGMDDIFGHTFDEISLAQQGGRLGRVIDTSKPTIDDSAIEESDLKLLAQYGERKLRDMGYMGVIDRLERGGHLSSNAVLSGVETK